MSLTRPAGCFLQLAGVAMLVLGLVLLFQQGGSVLMAVVVLAGGVGLVRIGGQPARNAMRGRR